MRRTRIFSIIIFLAALILCGSIKVMDYMNQDKAAPVISMEDTTIKVSCDAGTKKLLKGIQAKDSKDGDVTGNLLVESISNFVEPGRRVMTVAAFDSDNHVTKATREIVYTDYRSPRFSIKEPLRYPTNSQEILTNIQADDILDGDVSGNIKISTEEYIQINQPGTYAVELNVSNSAGDVSTLPVTVEIYDPMEDNVKPQITLSEYLVYTPAGQAVNPWDYVQQIVMEGYEYERGEDGILRSEEAEEEEARLLESNSTKTVRTSLSSEDVVMDQNVDYNTPGVYEVTFSIEDERENTGSMRLIVVVS